MQISYQEWLPSAELRHVVTAYWAVEGDGRGIPGPQILPDGHLEIVANLGDAVQLSGPAYTGAQPDRVIVGLLSQAVRMEYRGQVRTFGIRLHPARGPGLLKLAAGTLVDTIAPLHRLCAMLDASLREVFQAGREFDSAIRAQIDGVLVPLLRTAPSFDEDVAAIVDRMAASQLPLSVAQLAADSNLSQRQLQRRFVAAVGLPPKRFQRVIRFARSWQIATMSPREAWAAIASDNGYADQAHLVREFRAFGAESPAHMFTAEWYEKTELARVGGPAPAARSPQKPSSER